MLLADVLIGRKTWEFLVFTESESDLCGLTGENLV